MERKQLVELALVGLLQKRAEMERQIAEIEEELNPTPKRGNRPKRTAAQRKAQAKRMKEYWAKRKAKQSKKPPAKKSKKT